jgi:EmrB/QacA subfamily drug resistance transporter
MDDSNGRASGTPGLVPKDRRGGGAHTATDDRYKWVALSNTTLGIFMATLDSSIVIISLPAIFRGIKLDPLVPANIGYLLWMLMGYLVVTAVLVVTLGRIGDIFGRVKMYNLGFAIFTVASAALSLTPWHGPAGAMWLIVGRVIQGIGGALLMANSTAILTDAFPPQERGMAMGINMIAAILGSFIGLIVGGLLADIQWRAVFWINVPFGVFGTIWAYRRLRDMGERNPSRIDWWGNLTFGVGLVAVLIGMTYGLLPYGGHNMGWTSPMVLSFIIGGLVMLVAFGWVERHVDNPMFDLRLFKIRAFTAGNIAGLLSSIGRGGLMFMVVIWLQGIWLPLHGYSFERTPLWAGIYMLPTTAGFLVAGPVSGWLSDRYGARPFATGGMIVAAVTFALLMFLPANFAYGPFGLLLFLNGIGFGLFAAPNTTGIMNAVPARQRGAASGMRATFQNTGMLLSIGLFFSLMIAGLASALPGTMNAGLIAQGVPAAVANQVSHLPPVGSLFAAFLGYNPMKNLLGPVLNTLPAARATYITGKTFFPQLISDPFMRGLRIVFSAAVVMSVVAAAASWLRGERYVHAEEAVAEVPAAAEALAATGGGMALNSGPAEIKTAIKAATRGEIQDRYETSAPAPRAATGKDKDRRVPVGAAAEGSDVSEVPEELRGKLGEALLAFSDAQPALATVQSALAAGRAPRPDDLATLDKAAATLADVARPLGIEPTRTTLAEIEARLAAWERSRGVRGALRRLAGATGPAAAVGGLSGLSAEADHLAEEASWSPDDETRAVLLVRLVELADMASNGGDDERILALDAELRTALGPGAAPVVLAAGRGRLVLPADPFVDPSAPGGAGRRETGDVYAHSTGPVHSGERGPRSHT